jgi:hypothetical protein
MISSKFRCSRHRDTAARKERQQRAGFILRGRLDSIRVDSPSGGMGHSAKRDGYETDVSCGRNRSICVDC